jgi:hypothetical protein
MISVSEEITVALADYLKAKMPELKAVYDEFPEPNYKIQTPSASIMTQTPTFTTQTPKPLSLPDLDAKKQMDVKWIMGHYQIVLQLDLWAANKRQRNQLFESAFIVLNEQVWPQGLNLPLYRYYNQYAHYHVRAYDLMESEAGSQRQERRARIDLVADVNAIVERKEYGIANLQINNGDDNIITEQNLT